MQQRRGTAAQWTGANPTLAAGEIGYETDTGKFKIGNGSSAWTALNYYVDANSILDGAPGVLDTLNELAAALGDDPDFFISVAADLSLHAGLSTNVHGISNTADLATESYADEAADDAVDAHNLLTTNVHGITNTADLATQAYVDAASVHNAVTTNVHGITDTADLATQAYVDAASVHNAVTTNVHGITNTADLATEGYADDAADNAVDAHNLLTTNVHGIGNTADLATKAYADAAEVHNADTTNVHGITNTADLATQSYVGTQITNALNAHTADTTSVHGIADTTALVLTSDSRLSDTRTPTDDSVSTAKIVNSAVTADKLAGDSVTSAKIADDAVTSGKIADGAIVNADINASAAIDWTKLAVSSTVSSTELGYLDGVTSAIQTQLDAKYSSASATTDLALKAPLASPALTGTPTAPTATAGTNTTQIATTAFVTGAVSDLIASAPGALNTLDELAAALGDDANFASTVTTSLAAKAPIASPTFTGTVTVAANGIAFTDGTQAKEGVPSRTTINSVTDTYNLSTGGLTLRDSLIECNKATGFTVTIPANSTTAFPVGTSIDILQVGAGQVTIAGAAGVTVNATPGLKLRAQWSSATLFKRATDTWVVMGDLSA